MGGFRFAKNKNLRAKSSETLVDKSLVRKSPPRSRLKIFFELNRLCFCGEHAVPDELVVTRFPSGCSGGVLLVFFYTTV